MTTARAAVREHEGRTARDVIAELGRHPVLFMAGVLGMDLWRVPMQFADAVWQPRADVAVAGCHACSKTYTTAGICLHHVIAHEDGMVITTAPTWEQVRRVMWAEIKKAQRRSGIVFPVINQTEIRASDNEENVLIGVSTNDANRFQGYHGNILIVIDEAPGVFGELHEAIEGIRAGGNVKKLQLGNPTIAVGPFYDAFTRKSAGVRTFAISCLDTPNFAGVDLEDLLSRDKGDPYLDENPVPYLITRRFVWELADKYGADSGIFRSRALAQFPRQSADAIFGLALLQAARADAVMRFPDRVIVGIDVAGGGRDKTVATFRRGAQIERQRIYPGADPRPALIADLNLYRAAGDLAHVFVDETGIGHYFALTLADHRFPVTAINFSEAEDPDPAEDPRTRGREFANAKAQAYWTFRDALTAGAVKGLARVPDAYQQLTQLRYFADPRSGLIRIESKEKSNKRMRGSPDEAESVILAYQNPPVGAFAGQAAAHLKPRGTAAQPTARRALFGR